MHQIDMVQQATADPNSQALEKKLKSDLENLLIQEETLWRNKSRETWLTCKDLNTKFFHTSTLIRRRSNAVDFLKTNSGNWTSDRLEIGSNFVSHFSNLFSSSNSPIEDEMLDLFSPTITDDENQTLCSVPSELEVFQALSSFGSTKAPGPDGFTALFYKRYWSIVKFDVLNFVWSFFPG
ncbi:hypothetical protein SLA2020_274230 [Shorea laevis]